VTTGEANWRAEIIPKFSCLLQRGQPVVLHGDGSPTRRYLFAGDAADAFDTILHKGTMGQIYNVGSYDEISNLTLCSKLLTYLAIPHETQAQLHQWVKHTRDRPFNDHRYAVDGTKLRQLGWDQKTSFADGLALTVDWYRQYGERWWGDITQVLTPFPTVAGTQVIANEEPLEEFAEDIVMTRDEDGVILARRRKVNGVNGEGGEPEGTIR
jgi:dTDP-D-glucose 4,6-dehydratase